MLVILYPQEMDKSHQNLFATYGGNENSRKFTITITRESQEGVKLKTNSND